MYSGEYDVCDVTLSVYPHRAGLKNMPGHGGNRTYDLWNNNNNNNTNYLYSAKVMYELFIYASLRLKFQITTCERAYSLRVVWPAEEVVPTRSCRFFLSLYSRNIL